MRVGAAPSKLIMPLDWCVTFAWVASNTSPPPTESCPSLSSLPSNFTTPATDILPRTTSPSLINLPAAAADPTVILWFSALESPTITLPSLVKSLAKVTVVARSSKPAFNPITSSVPASCNTRPFKATSSVR